MKTHYLAVALLSLSVTYAGDLKAATAAACFNARLVQQGVVVEQRYRTVDKFGGGKTISNSTQTLVGREKFKGKNALLARAEIKVTQGGVTTVVHSDSYILVQKSKKRVRSLGGVGQSFQNGIDQGTAEITFNPPQLFRYDVSPGQRHTQKFTITTKARGSLGGGTSSMKQTVTRKYLGRQTIKVPVGRRTTCKFKVVTTVRQFLVSSKIVSTEWYDVKSGMLIKESGGGSTTVLLKGSIDGVKI
ncbi:hypothetical protein [Pseudohalioglobus lutimaris]|uniref:DUF3108 domain-containing protein n=1 Tax=Pseudohalioglobus lutimaris TaxID=1737061 RepID=A0A2N5X1S0_9GAMM|nr:hypothetical protein [Pseudohalioglobus lutimaris]PLW68444.1 hypothetical protein C0039_12395 [Pseudohalioglobus lutimaris]